MNSEKVQIINMKPVSADTSPPLPLKGWFPWLAQIILVTNVVLFVVTMYVNNCPKLSFPPANCYASFLGRFSFQPLEQNPLLGPSEYPMIKMGGLHVETLVHKHQAWRLFTSLWVHAGVFQLFLNMFGYLIIGIFLEKTFGFVRIGLVYVISGMGGNLLSVLFTKSDISVGASPAIFGLLGGMLSDLLTNWEMHRNKIAKMLILFVTIVIYLALGTFPFVDNFSHVGGLISGFLLGFVFLIRPHYKWVNWTKSNLALPVPPKHKPYQYALCIISLMLLSAGLLSGLVLFFKGVDLNSYCSWCHYVTCFSNFEWNCKKHYDTCEWYQIGNQLNVTCVTNGRNGIFPQSSGNLLEQSEELCLRLCDKQISSISAFGIMVIAIVMSTIIIH